MPFRMRKNAPSKTAADLMVDFQEDSDYKVLRVLLDDKEWRCGEMDNADKSISLTIALP